MARVPYIQRADLPPDQQQNHDSITELRGGRLAKVFSLFLNAPEMAARIGDVGAYGRFRSVVPDDVREIAILATAREFGCQYEFTHHVPIAKQADVRDVVIEGINAETTEGMRPEESAIVEYARQVLSNRVDDAAFAAIEGMLGRQGAVEATMIVGYYAMMGHTMMALGVELEEGVVALLPRA